MQSKNTAYHQPVLLQESIEGLNIDPDGIYVDATYGGGGHSKEIINHLKKGKLVAFDQDTEAVANLFNDRHFLFVGHNFRFLKHFLRYHNISQIHGVLADLGVSSHHFDSSERGFSFRKDAELDMRMNRESKLTAKEILNSYTEAQLNYLFKHYGELKNALMLARTIVSDREKKPFHTTSDLQNSLHKLIPKNKENQFLAQVFQALRIEVNREIHNLKELLRQAEQYLVPGGRLVVISYHSLEDRLVKNYIRWGSFDHPPQKDVYGRFYTPLKPVNKKIITPGEEEIKINNRARSARLRIAEKVTA
ncbi:MAG: 16S rRNA (cytosine(1402)-N(4))-methyltransferase RsmH [Bacteroidetes bacterium]|jgi:16S rRNA (cytosine1402-N4)-methyltransferase|nr:16S rRNA (cytosine(1402)-N(4))-methyltransferase RsmH [Bacteroidota bacterium]